MLQNERQRQPDFEQRGEFRGNQEPNIVKVILLGNIVIEFDVDQTPGWLPIVSTQLNVLAFAP